MDDARRGIVALRELGDGDDETTAEERFGDEKEHGKWSYLPVRVMPLPRPMAASWRMRARW